MFEFMFLLQWCWVNSDCVNQAGSGAGMPNANWDFSAQLTMGRRYPGNFIKNNFRCSSFIFVVILPNTYIYNFCIKYIIFIKSLKYFLFLQISIIIYIPVLSSHVLMPINSWFLHSFAFLVRVLAYTS